MLKLNVGEKDLDYTLIEAPVEEHFIMRLPDRLAHKLGPLISKREVPADLSFSFHDPRNGSLSFGKESYKTQLVDMPCIIESLKTIDNKQFYKIANVSQMLIVQDPNNPSFFKDNTTPHGLSECLRNVRTQRFRKRMSKKIIEDVEAEVERLLLADIEAEQLQYEVHERKDGDESVLGDDDFDMGQSEAGDANVDDFDLDTEIKEALEAEPEEEQEQEQEQESEEESDNEESENEGELDEGSDGDNDEKSQWKKQRNALKNEIQDLEKKVAEKEGAASKQINPIMKKRFEDIVSKLQAELDIKKSQLEKLKDQIETQAEQEVLFLDEPEENS